MTTPMNAKARTEVARHLAAGDRRRRSACRRRSSGSRRWDRTPSGSAPARWRRTSRSRVARPMQRSVARANAHPGATTAPGCAAATSRHCGITLIGVSLVVCCRRRVIARRCRGWTVLLRPRGGGSLGPARPRKPRGNQWEKDGERDVWRGTRSQQPTPARSPLDVNPVPKPARRLP